MRQKCCERSYTLLLIVGAGTDVGAEKTDEVAEERGLSEEVALLTACLTSSSPRTGPRAATKSNKSHGPLIMIESQRHTKRDMTKKRPEMRPAE